MTNEGFSINVNIFPPESPPNTSYPLPWSHEGDYPSAQCLNTFAAGDSFVDKHLSLNLDNTHSSSYLSTSPTSPSSSMNSSLSSPLLRMFDDFSVDDPVSGTGLEEPLRDDTFWLESEQDILNPFSMSISSRGRGLQLTIDPCSGGMPHSDFMQAGVDDTLNPTINPNFLNGDGTEYKLFPFHPEFADVAYSSNLLGAKPSPSISPSSPTPSFGSVSSTSASDSLLSPNKPLPGSRNNIPRRHSYSDSSTSRGFNAGSNSLSSSLSPSSGHDTYAHTQSNHTLHSRSQSNGNIPSFAHGVNVLQSPLLLSPNSISNTGNNFPQRRHTDGPPPSAGCDLPLRRSRSTTTVRSRSPYARNRDLEDHSSCERTDDIARPCPRTPDHPWPSTRPSETSPSSPSHADVFRSYDSGSTPHGFPILHRETIASDAVLQASAKRRKKVPTYECRVCEQKLTSRDNLNNHMDAHDGIRRHQCRYCEERFRTRSVLKRHQKSAKCPGSKPFLPKLPDA